MEKQASVARDAFMNGPGRSEVFPSARPALESPCEMAEQHLSGPRKPSAARQATKGGTAYGETDNDLHAGW